MLFDHSGQKTLSPVVLYIWTTVRTRFRWERLKTLVVFIEGRSDDGAKYNAPRKAHITRQLFLHALNRGMHLARVIILIFDL